MQRSPVNASAQLAPGRTGRQELLCPEPTSPSGKVVDGPCAYRRSRHAGNRIFPGQLLMFPAHTTGRPTLPATLAKSTHIYTLESAKCIWPILRTVEPNTPADSASSSGRKSLPLLFLPLAHRQPPCGEYRHDLGASILDICFWISLQPPLPIMALPKRIIKETERLLAEPYVICACRRAPVRTPGS